MRVLLDTTFARRGPSGTAVYIAELSAALEGIGVEVLAACNDARRPPAGGGAGSVRNLISDRRWVQRELPAIAQRERADVIHHPLPALSRRAPCPQVVTVHDIAFVSRPDLFAPAFRVHARVTQRAAARGAASVVCVSSATRRAVAASWGVGDQRLVLARHGPGQRLPAPHRHHSPSHFLYVGDDEPRKQLRTLLEAHARYRSEDPEPLELVVAGRARPPHADGVRVVADPDPAALAELHAGAAALVHPAVEEGFGLTLAEAMAAGTPVLAARCDAAEELCDGAAALVAPGDVQALCDGMRRLARDSVLSASLAELGRQRAALLSWERSARDHLRAYTLALR